MHARFASGLFLALGLADLAVLDLFLAPRLAAEQAALDHALPAATSPEAAWDTAPPPAAKRIAPSPRPAPRATAAPAAEARPVVPDVLFGIESESVTRLPAILLLDRVARDLRAHPGRRLLLRGHADRLGSAAHNLTLSRRRAEAVRRILTVRGAPGDRIAVEAVGDTEPADPGSTPAAWAKNRRVQILWR